MRTKPNVKLATLGNIDHGKTTLAAAITQYAACLGMGRSKHYNEINDAPEENAVHVNYETDKRVYEQIDFPGHEDNVKNLITEVTQVDAAVLVVSATDGSMPQTREHILLARQIGIPCIIVYLNKCDMVDDEEMLILQEDEVREVLARNGYPGDSTPIVRGSALEALNGEESEYGIQSIRKLLDILDCHIPDPCHAAS